MTVVEDHYAAQARQGEAASLLAERQWRRVDVDDLDSSWAQIVDRLTLMVGSAQLGAARAGAAYVPLVLAELGQSVAADGEVNPNRFAGVASDGRPLDSLLYSAVVHTRQALGRQLSPAEALQVGSSHLETIVRTQVADADRGASGVAITARPRVDYVRMVSPPCCQRCAVLAGKRFGWNDGFLRHPRCDCRHVPAGEGGPAGFAADIDPDQVKDLTQAQRQAIADGADMNQVINAHRRGARGSDGMTTSEGATLRGGKRRLTPEGIYRTSSSREEAVEKLRANGYMVDRRPATPGAAPAPRTITQLSDVELEDEMSSLMSDPDGFDNPRMDQLAREMDVRDARRQREAFFAEQRETEQAERAERERLGYGAGGKQWRRDKGSSERALRDEYETFVEVSYVAAEQELNGVLLSKAGQAAARRGELDVRDLFTKRRRDVKRWASEELQEWFSRNPRMSFPEFRAGARSDDPGRAARRRFRDRGYESEFG